MAICFNKKILTFQLGFFVGLLGLEPRKTAPKTVVLPLHHRPMTILLVTKNHKLKLLYALLRVQI
jgi:hypothetical protein